jgi:Flp pilus assembly protein TadD
MEAAARLCRALLAEDPGSAPSQANLAIALKQTGRVEEAVGAYRRSLLLAPDHPQIHNNLGSALHLAGAADAATECFRKAVILAPNLPGHYHNLGSLLRDRAKLDEAAIGFHYALRLDPGHPDLQGGLAVLEQYRDRMNRAIPGYRRALALQPNRADFYINLGNGLRQAGELPSAEAAYRRALSLAPEHSDARFNLSLLLLLTGRLREAWPGYEHRWETQQLASERRNFPAPLWKGETDPGKTLLLHGEQGFGDTLQFCRYVALAKAKGLRILLEVQPPLRRLMETLAGCERVIARGDPLPSFDLHCPLLSLPHLLGTHELADIPATIPYVHADTKEAALWAARIAALPGEGLRVGLVWAGAPRRESPVQAAFDRRRSLPLPMLAPILALAGIRFFSLQKGVLASPGLVDFMAEMRDFADTAALVANLDLVISVDTSVAHLAGALGKPVWLLNRFDTDWRWLMEGEETPWYPTMRLFRQRSSGDWAGVIGEVVEALEAKAF